MAGGKKSKESKSKGQDNNAEVYAKLTVEDLNNEIAALYQRQEEVELLLAKAHLWWAEKLVESWTDDRQAAVWEELRKQWGNG